MTTSLEETLIRYIDAELVDVDRQGEVDADTELLMDEYIDSMNVVHLVVHLKTQFGCDVPPEDITIEHFGTVSSLSAYLRGRGVADPSTMS